MPHPLEHRGALAALVLFCASAFAAAQIPEPRLNTLSAQGVYQGGTVQVSLSGVDLEDCVLRFSHPGIKAVRDPKNPMAFEVSAAAEVPVGLYDVRAVGRHGVTNPRRFEVSGLPELEALTKAVSRELSQEVSVPCVVRGNAPKQGIQWFKIHMVAGREVVFDCHASQIDSRLDPMLMLYDAEGRELAQSRARPLRWKPAVDQTLYLALRDLISNGGSEHFYRLYIGEPGAFPANALLSPLVFPSAAGAIPELEPNGLERPQKLTAPFSVKGTFAPAKDVDAFEFEAKKGETWWVECLSHRLGAPTLPRVVVERLLKDADGKITVSDPIEIKAAPVFPGDPDFDGYHFDPVGSFTAKEDGFHRAVLRDLNNSGSSGAERPYLFEIRKAAPDFALLVCVLPPVPNKAYLTFTGPLISVRAANIRPNQVLPLRVLVVRRDGFEGEISVNADGLPNGVRAEPCVIGPKQTEGTLLLAAESNAAPWVGAVKVSGSARVGEQSIVRPASPTTPLWESTAVEFVEPSRNRLAAELAMAVVADAPFSSVVRASQPTLEATVGGKVKIGLKVERTGSSGAAAALKFKPSGLVGLEKAKELEVPAKQDSAEYELDLAPLKLAPGSYTVWFRGEEKTKRMVKGKETDSTEILCSHPVTLKVVETVKP